jgi:hypothetical protein
VPPTLLRGDLEFVNPLAAILVDINIALGINRNAVRLVELAGKIRSAEACLGMAKRAPPNQFAAKCLGFGSIVGSKKKYAG